MAARLPPKKKTAVGHRTRVGRERRARTRAHIVDCAQHVFAEKGPDVPVIDDFIRTAGIARGTFYNYFRTTDELLTAVTTAMEDGLMTSIEAGMADLTDPVDRLSMGPRLWLRWSLADRTLCAFIVRSRFRSSLVEELLALDLQAGRKQGAFRFRHVEVARDLVVGTVLEAMHRILTGRVPRTLADDVARQILQGLGVEASSIERSLARPIPPLAALPRPRR
jgi:AcrR family transcriptional regulator